MSACKRGHDGPRTENRTCMECAVTATRLWRESNKEWSRANARRWYHQNKSAAANARMTRRFGVSMTEYETMLSEQGGVCAACGGRETAKHKSGVGSKALAIDHDHNTGVVRGLLCQSCNLALGHLMDSPARVAALLKYIERSPCART